MSSVEYFYNSNRSDRICVPRTSNGGDKHNIKGFFPREIISWTEDIARKIFFFFRELDYPYRRYVDIPFEDPLRSEIRRFLLSLDAYIESTPKPVIPEKEILYGSVHKDFAKKLKRIKKKSFITSWGSLPYDLPEWWEETKSYHIRDIGQIFNYQYLIFFDQDEEVDDWKLGMLPVDIKQETLDKFRQQVRDILPDRSSFQRIDPLEITSALSGSSSYTNKKRIKSYKIKENHLNFSKKRKSGLRTVINVGVENTRDSVLLQPEDLNTISLIENQLYEILSCIEGHIHLKNKDRALKRAIDLSKIYTFYIQRDLEKEGITKPRELLKVMLEELNNAYPDLEAFRYTDFYDNYSLIVNDQEYLLKRGHGRGMANTLPTLMQLAIFNLIAEEMSDEIGEVDMKCLALNDDYVVGLKTEYHADLYWEKEDEILSDLGLFRVPEKSFQSVNKFTIAEIYIEYEKEHKKNSYQLRESLLTLACYNICQAKNYFASVQNFIDPDCMLRYIEEFKRYWTYEFFKDEYHYPVIFGGWINDTLNGIDMSFKIIEDIQINPACFRSYEAQKESFRVKKKGKIKEDLFLKQVGIFNVPEAYQRFFNIHYESERDFLFGRKFKSRQFFRKYWDTIAFKRKKRFEKSSLKDLIKIRQEIINDNPAKTYYPAEDMIKYYARFEFWNFDIKDLYIDANPKMALISKLFSTQYPFKEEFSIRFTNEDIFSKTYYLQSKEVGKSNSHRLQKDYLISERAEIIFPVSEELANENYINPIGIGSIASNISWGKGYPIIFEEYRNPLVKEKKNIFGRFLTLEEQIYLTRKKIGRDVIKYIFDTYGIDVDLIYFLDEISKIPIEEDIEIEPPEPKKVQREGVNYITMSILLGNYDDFTGAFFNSDLPREFENDEVERIFNRARFIYINNDNYGSFGVRKTRETYREFVKVYADDAVRIVLEHQRVEDRLYKSIFDDPDFSLGFLGQDDEYE
jgi:hypothetical protein